MSEFGKKFPEALNFFEGNEFAASTFINKYALRDKEGNILEKDPNQTIERVMKVLADAMPEEKTIDAFFDENGNPTCKLSRPSENFLRRIYKDKYDEFLLSSSKGVGTWFDIFVEACNKFNGPVPQGSILAAAGDLSHPQSISNCYVIDSPLDSVSSIMNAGERSAHIYRRRGGVGVSLSKLRPCGTPVANAAKTSSGAVGWMEYFSNICRVIGQNSRRGALLLSIDIKHPDALAFAEIKQDLTKVTGANISIQLSDEFMEAVMTNGVYVQQWPVDSSTPTIIQEVKAKDLWNRICECAWNTGEPGLLFFDEIKRNLPSQSYWETLSCNPCGEQPLPAGESCRLLSICLIKYVVNPFTTNANFNFELFERDIRIAMRMLDAVVSEEQNCIRRIIDKINKDIQKEQTINEENKFLVDLDQWTDCLDKCIKGRRCGLGTHGLGDCLSQLCLRYDSNAALVKIEEIYKTLRDTAYDESIEMAKEYGPFPIWDWNLEKDCEFFKRLPIELLEKMKKYGRRNMVILTNSPTGSISLLSQVSSGIEPTFRQSYTRRRKVNHSDSDAKVTFVDANGDKWEEFIVFEKNVQRYFRSKNQECPMNFEDSLLPEFFISSDKIDWKRRVEVQSTITRYMDASISSTVNIPKEASVDIVRDIYERAWKNKLKGITVYREGSRDGVLLSKEVKIIKDSIQRSEAPKRPDKLPCDVHFTSVKGVEYVVVVGLLNGSVYEVFCGKYNKQIPKKHFSGFVEKKGKSKYLLSYIEDVEFKQIDINKYFDNDDYAAATRLLSMSLRHGVPLEYIFEQLQKSSSSIVEFGAAVSRVLKKYIKIENLKALYKTCSNCGSTNISIDHKDGCVSIQCFDCNTFDSKCG